MRLSARSLLSPTRSSVRTSENSSAKAPFHALDQPRDRTEEANACFDRYRQQIECIGEVVADLRPARRRATTEQQTRNDEANDAEEAREEQRRTERLAGDCRHEQRRNDAAGDQQKPVHDIGLRGNAAREAGRSEALRQSIGQLLRDQPLAEPLDRAVVISAATCRREPRRTPPTTGGRLRRPSAGAGPRP